MDLDLYFVIIMIGIINIFVLFHIFYVIKINTFLFINELIITKLAYKQLFFALNLSQP